MSARQAQGRRRSAAAASISISTPSGRSAPKAITASAARLGSLPVPNRGVKVPQWQLDSLAYYDQIGAVRYAAQFWARGLASIRFFVGEKDERGEIKESTDRQALDIFERIQDPMGGMVQITSAYGQLRFLAGECYLVWTPEHDGEPESWEIVSVLEMRKQSRRKGRETWSRITAPGLTPEELVEAPNKDFEPLPNEVIVYRMWKRHPAYSMMADAPMRSVLADCEEIVRCTHTINARLISRLAGPGIFAIPQSWKVKSLGVIATQDAPAISEAKQNPEADPFQKRLTDAMMAAIQTPGSAESVAPIVISVPADSTDKAHLYKIWDPNEVIRELDTREKAVHRFAVGVDMPPGKVEGIEGSTHWNAWAIDKEGMEHLKPVATDFGNDVGGCYLRPALRELGRDDWSKFVISFDPAEAVTNPDEFEDAKEMYDRRAVGKKYLRRSGNASDDDAMKDEELAEAIFVATRQVVEVDGEVVVLENPVESETPDDAGAVDENAPDEPAQEDVEDQEDSGELSSLGYVALGAAEVAIQEVRKTIGLRVRSALAGGKCRECVERVKDVPAAAIVATLGRETIDEAGLDLVRLAEDTAIGFAEVMVQRLSIGDKQALAFQEVIELHSVASIYEEDPGLPPGFTGMVKALT